MMQHDILFNKILGCWTGKIAGGTYGMPVELKEKKYIEKLTQNGTQPMSGWTSYHNQGINDDEQYELISLLALESLSDAEFASRKNNNKILEAALLGRMWEKNLIPKFAFTAEKCAYENALNHKVPWDHAADEVYNNRYQNPYYDWIGAQMKGELYGMLAPAWNWHLSDLKKSIQENAVTASPQEDLTKLRWCLELSLQDAWIAHRGVGIVGELFVSALVAVGIDYNPMQSKIRVKYSKNVWNDEDTEEEITQIGITAEILKDDILRIKKALQLFAEEEHTPPMVLPKEDVSVYFSMIDEVIRIHDANNNPNSWMDAWKLCETMNDKYFSDLKSDAKKRLSSNKAWLSERLRVLENNWGVHVMLNNAAIVIGLLYADGDAFQAMRIATECGLDTDCNSGNAGAIMGAYLGQQLLPFYIKRFVKGQIFPAIKDWEDLSLNTLANRTLRQAERLEEL